MGSDMAMSPPPPDPLDVQVKQVMQHRNELQAIVQLQAKELKELRQQHVADGQMIARLMREKEAASLGHSLDGEIVTQCSGCREYGAACRCA